MLRQLIMKVGKEDTVLL